MAVATMGGRVGGMGEGMDGVSGWPEWDSSVSCLIWPFFGTLLLFSQLGCFLLSASYFLSVPPDLIPSVCLTLSVWLGLLALSLYQSLGPHPLTGSLCLASVSVPPSPHPQEFLKKEFSAENVTFWKACERFQQIPASDTQQVGRRGN